LRVLILVRLVSSRVFFFVLLVSLLALISALCASRSALRLVVGAAEEVCPCGVTSSTAVSLNGVIRAAIATILPVPGTQMPYLMLVAAVTQVSPRQHPEWSEQTLPIRRQVVRPS
jgi:hypothetical protein